MFVVYAFSAFLQPSIHHGYVHRPPSALRRETRISGIELSPNANPVPQGIKLETAPPFLPFLKCQIIRLTL